MGIENTRRSHAPTGDALDVTESGDFGAPPLTPEQAAQWRRKQPAQSSWGLVMWQFAVGLLLGLGLGWVSGRWSLAWSAWYGSAAVALPAAWLVHSLARSAGQSNAAAALLGFFVREAVKVFLTVALLVLAPRVVKDLSWLALLAGLLVTLKVYVVALLFMRAPRSIE